MNQPIKQYILELIEDNNHELEYVIKDYDNNKIKDDHPRFVRTLTKESLLKNILKVINNLEAENNGV
jgi:DNA integrity scanning protein DisA with diadenylate cyclase activity